MIQRKLLARERDARACYAKFVQLQPQLARASHQKAREKGMRMISYKKSMHNLLLLYICFTFEHKLLKKGRFFVGRIKSARLSRVEPAIAQRSGPEREREREKVDDTVATASK